MSVEKVQQSSNGIHSSTASSMPLGVKKDKAGHQNEANDISDAAVANSRFNNKADRQDLNDYSQPVSAAKKPSRATDSEINQNARYCADAAKDAKSQRKIANNQLDVARDSRDAAKGAETRSEAMLEAEKAKKAANIAQEASKNAQADLGIATDALRALKKDGAPFKILQQAETNLNIVKNAAVSAEDDAQAARRAAKSARQHALEKPQQSTPLDPAITNGSQYAIDAQQASAQASSSLANCKRQVSLDGAKSARDDVRAEAARANEAASSARNNADAARKQAESINSSSANKLAKDAADNAEAAEQSAKTADKAADDAQAAYLTKFDNPMNLARTFYSDNKFKDIGTRKSYESISNDTTGKYSEIEKDAAKALVNNKDTFNFLEKFGSADGKLTQTDLMKFVNAGTPHLND